MVSDDKTLNWLLEGDPVIRWQTLRDLYDAPQDEWEAERRKTIEYGWGKQFIDALQPDNTWIEGRWTGTVWTLRQVMDCGLPADYPRLRSAGLKFIDMHLTYARSIDRIWLLKSVDLCHLGFWLRIGAYFLGADERLSNIIEFIFSVQLDDGGWNCRIRTNPKTVHSSFHTTFNVLDGLSLAADKGLIDQKRFRESEARALDFALVHKMYRSDKTGAIIDERFTHLTYPSGWHYNIIRGLDYMSVTPEIGDPRLDDPISLLERRRSSSGRWPVEKRILGATHFDMERFGTESRWITLKASRIIQGRKIATQTP